MQLKYLRYSAYSSNSSSSYNPASKFCFYDIKFLIGLALTSSLEAFQKDYKTFYQTPQKPSQTLFKMNQHKKVLQKQLQDFKKKNIYFLETGELAQVEKSNQIFDFKKGDQQIEQKTRCQIQLKEVGLIGIEAENKCSKNYMEQIKIQSQQELKNMTYNAQVPQIGFQTRQIQKKRQQLKKRQVHNWDYFQKKQSRQLKRLCK